MNLFFILLITSIITKTFTKVTLIRKTLREYSCLEFLTYVAKKYYTPQSYSDGNPTDYPEELNLPIDLRNFATFVQILEDKNFAAKDKNAAEAFKLLQPMVPQDIPVEMWNSALYHCTIGPEKDSIVQHVYRLGLIKTARVLQTKGFYDISLYLYPRDSKNESIMHLATRTGNSLLILHLAELLQGHTIYLITSEFSLNAKKQTPYELAEELGLSGPKLTLSELYESYRFLPKQELPKPFVTPQVIIIDFIVNPNSVNCLRPNL